MCVQNQFFKTLIELKKMGNKKLGAETPPRRRINRGCEETVIAKLQLCQFFAIDLISFHFFHIPSRNSLKTLKDHH